MIRIKKSCIYIYIYIYIYTVSWSTEVEGDSKVPFSLATTLRCRRGCDSFPRIAPLTLDPYLIMLSVKQIGIKYRHFWYASTWDWTLFFQTIGENSNHYSNGPVKYIYSRIIIFKSHLQHGSPFVPIIHCSQ